VTDRRVTTAVIVAAIVLFAIVSAPRLQLDYAPALALPELRVNLSVGGGASDPEEITTRWVVPIESAIRSLGDVTGTRAEVTGHGASIDVRFHRGTDVEVKAARLSSELAGLRAKLPARSSLDVWPATQGGNRPGAYIALTNPRVDARSIGDLLRAARGVRDVATYGLTDREVEIVMTDDSVPAPAVLDAVQALAPRALGTIGPRKVPVVVAPRTTELRDAPLRAGTSVIRLGAVADVRNRTAEATTLARVNGKPVSLLAVYRDNDVSLFAFDASIRERLRGVAWQEVSSDAADLRAMLRRVGAGALAASLVLAAIGFVYGRRRGLILAIYLPLAVAIAMNVFRLTGIGIDAQTIVVACIAFAGIAPFAVGRLVAKRNELTKRNELSPLAIAAAFVLLLPLAATFGSAALAPLLAPAARAFAIAASSALAACLAIPPVGVRASAHDRWQRTMLRESATVLLAVATFTCLLITYFGAQLDPRRVGEKESSSLDIEVRMPGGATLAQTSALAARVEKGLGRVAGIERFTSFLQAGWANIHIELQPAMNGTAARSRLMGELGAAVPFVPGMISLADGGRGRGVQFDDEFELVPIADADGIRYRVLLKGTDAEALRAAVELIASRLSRLDIRRSQIVAGWPAPAPRAALVPRLDTTPADAERMAARLAELTLPPVPHRLHDGRLVRVIARGAPHTPDVVPQRADVLAREPSLEARFELRNELMPGGAMRELGRFVLPVDIDVKGYGDERLLRRENADRTLATMPLPAGITLERPSLAEWTLSLPKLRLLALAVFLPMLLLAASAIALASLRGAFAALAPSIAGFAAAAPVMQFAAANVDELTLLAMGGAICCTTAIGVVALLRAGEQTRAAYESQRRFSTPTLLAIAAIFVLLAVPASAPAAVTDGWRAPLLASLAVLGIGIPAALLVGPASGFVARDLRRRRTPVARAASHPEEWRDAPPLLTIRNVTKIYGGIYAGGFRALQRVSFDLRPGIIGLLGPNGAGKTTLLRVMTGLLLPTRGQVLYRGVPVGPDNLAEYRRLIGFLPQEFNAYAGLTAFDFLDFWALERGMTDIGARREEVERLLALVGLADDIKRRVRDFSGGMRQRIGIARALLGDPPLLVVDEPTTGLDLESRNRFRDLLGTLAADRIIILSTHIAGDVEATASRILLLAKGTLRWDGTPDQLIARARGRVFDLVVAESEVRALTHQFRVTTRHRVAGGIHVRGVVPAGATLPGAAAEPTLEEAYLAEVAGDRAMRASGFAFLFGS
jgi:ABC-2 type transport system ATP-binding protein